MISQTEPFRANTFESDHLSSHEFASYWTSKHSTEEYQHPDPSDEFADALTSFFDPINGYILDHGCGSGRLAAQLATRGHRIALNDISPIAVQSSLNRLKRASLEQSVAHTWAKQIYAVCPSEQWGAFLTHRVLHTLPRRTRDAAILSLATYLKPGGRGIAVARSVHCPRYQVMLSDKEFRSIDATGTTFVRDHPFRFLHFFSEGELEQLFHSAGLDVIRSDRFRERTGNLQRTRETETNEYWLILLQKPERPRAAMVKPSVASPLRFDNSFPAIATCLFDLDGTLMWSPSFNAATKAEAVTCVSNEYGIEHDIAAQLIDTRRTDLSHHNGYTPALSATLVSLGIPLHVWSKYQARVHVEDHVHPDDEVSQLVSALSQSFYVILYTNMARRLAQRAIAHLRMDCLANRLVCSEDIGIPKPSTSALRTIAGQFKFDIRHTLAIGDRYFLDIHPVVQLGGRGFVSDSKTGLLACCDELLRRGTRNSQ
jgi:FMN phosphatase YigB (HAD superfamily)/SAM-dependent methyltransferase